MPGRIHITKRRRNPSGETALVSACIEWLGLHGIFAWRNNTAAVSRRDAKGREFFAFHGMRGASDIFGVLPGTGMFLVVECKVMPNKPSAAQIEFLDAIRRAGGVAVLAYSLDDLALAIERFA